ncbi:toll-like receptor 13 [Engraulis encrasicolus]|uniref:toll-like receptor 13 n=1 Tax=Engraulis encrasicolus TaxID=184585 RepID=UPI002FD5287F
MHPYFVDMSMNWQFIFFSNTSFQILETVTKTTSKSYFFRNMTSLGAALFHVFLYGFFGAPSHQFFVRNCNLTMLPNDTMCHVSCCDMGLKTVPLQLPTHVKELDISRNHISKIKVTDFRNISNLRALNVSYNNISWIDDGAFQDLVHLQELFMTRNQLKHITRGCLQGLVSLSVLRLDHNKIEDIDPSAFDSLSNLTHVNLANNRLIVMESVKGILHLPNLFELKIENNNITSFVSHNLSTKPLQLRRLDLFSNPLKMFQITNNILPYLCYLDISYCGHNRSFQWIVEDPSFLGSVETLNVSGLQTSDDLTVKIVQTFNSSLKMLQVSSLTTPHFEDFLDRTCSRIHKLYLLQPNISVLSDRLFKSCNQLQEIQFRDTTTYKMSSLVFEGLNQLQTLKVRNTNITELNNITHVLPTVSLLDFSNNKIKQVTCSDFSNHTVLARLYLYKNHIDKISKCTFHYLPNLKLLLLGSNRLLTVRNAFKGHLPKLKTLDLHSNKITKLHDGTFSKLSALQYLRIYDNQINSISKNAFDGLVHLKELVLTANHLKQSAFSDPRIFNGLQNLELLNLNDNSLQFESQNLTNPPFTMLKSLKVLMITGQRHFMNIFPSNLLKGLSSLIKLHGVDLNIQYIHPETFVYTPKLRYLDLSKNVFTTEMSLSPKIFQPIGALSELHLKHSSLPSLNFIIGANLTQLRSLQVMNNQLQGFNQTIIESLPNLEYVDLQNNTFICDCSNEWLLHWAKKSNQTQVIFFNKYQCSYPSTFKSQYLEKLETSSCTLNLEFLYFAGSSSLVTVTLLVSFIYNFMRFQLVYAYYLFLAYLYDKNKKQRQKQHGFMYDAFISYNSQDELWVLRELLPNLEAEQGCRLCLHHRDFEPGKPIIDNIVDGIYNSRKTICVVTRNYLRSEWCSREIQVASFRLFEENNDVLILVFLEDIPSQQLSPYHRMRKLVKKQTYLCWPKPGEDRTIFWQKLRMAMNTKKEENPILLGQE